VQLFDNGLKEERRTTVMNDSKIHAIMIITTILSLAVVAAVTPEYEAQGAHLKSFTTYEELRNFITTSSQSGNHYYSGDWAERLIAQYGLSNTLSTKESSSILPEYSTTNVQVEGVDEADVVKTDGTYIYAISNQTVVILRAYPPEETQIPF
jgi:uncharacterized secreted protein with C-terminal beta-propeller domain